MHKNRITLPDMNWFEFDILSQLFIERKYGNEILNDLNMKFGEGSISSGKLYPALQKLEKKGYIKRTPIPKEDHRDKGTRGVERVYFTITSSGIKELENATTYSINSLFHGMMNRLQMEVAERVFEILSGSMGASFKCGIIKHDQEKNLEMIFSRMDQFNDVDLYFLVIPCMHSAVHVEHGRSSMENFSYLPSKIDDIPLKDGYLDVLCATMLFHDLDDWDPLLKEVKRVLRPGGIFVVVDFARFESYIMEAMMQHFHKARCEEEKLLGLRAEELEEALSGFFKDVKTERMKDIILAYGKKED